MSSGATRENVLAYLRWGRALRPVLRGDDLMALGVPRGPAVGEVLARLRAARLDGEVRSLKEEKALVRRLLEGQPPVTTDN
jgi:tRNA nucleotidyltransferase (CCA-adding enzyme)